MAKDRSVEFWKEAIRNGQRFQIKYGGANEWYRYKEYYRHHFKDGMIPVNMVFSICRSMVAQTYIRRPSVVVTPTKPGIIYQLHARIVQSIDRWLLEELFVKGEIKKMIMDAFLAGIGIGFNGYDSEYGWSSDNAEGNAPATLTQFNKKGYRLEYNSFINPGMPWFLRCRPDDVVFPWGTQSAKDAEWIAMRKIRLLDDLKQDRKYSTPSDLKGTHVQQRTGPEGQIDNEMTGYFDPPGEERQWVELWQIHDAKTGRIIAMTYESDKLLRDDVDEMQIEGIPCETLVFNPDPDYIYGVPDSRIIEPQLLENNEIRTQFMKVRRRDIPKLLYKKRALTADEVNKLLDEDVKAAIAVDEDVSIREAIMDVGSSNGALYQGLSLASELARQDIRETVGFSRVNVGEFQGKTHVSAEETKQVMMRGDIRVDERKDAVADLLTNIVRKFNQTIFTHWTVPMVKDIVGLDGAKWWLQFTGPEIKSEYTIRIDPASTIPQDPESKKKDAIEMAKAWAEMNMGMVKQGAPVPEEIQRYFFSCYDGIDIDKILSQQGIRPQLGPQTQPVPAQVAANMMMKR